MKDLTSRLKTRIELETPTETPDGGGGFTTSWVNFATVWAEFKSTRSRKKEFFNDSQIQDVGTYRVTIRHLDNVTTKMRIKMGTRYFNIIAVVDPDQVQKILEIYAEEGVSI